MASNQCDLYLRLSDGRVEEALTGREARLRSRAGERGWAVRNVIIENDINPDGSIKPASAYKRKRVVLPTGHVTYRVDRKKFQDELLPGMRDGINVIVEYGDRIARNHRDGEDFLEAAEIGHCTVISLNGRGSLTSGGTDDERDWFRDEIKYAEREGRAKKERAVNGRERWVGKSYQGGRRPFGFRVDPDGTEHHRNLIVDEVEAAVIKTAADQIVNKGVSLKAVARDIRAQGIRTVTGNTFDAQRLKEALIKPTVAGLAVKCSNPEHKTKSNSDLHEAECLIPAPWQAILDQATWEALVSILLDKTRRTNSSKANEPTWLLSCYATCGACGEHMKVSGKERNRYYVCSRNDGCNTRCRAIEADEFISGLVVARLSRPDAVSLLKPPARKDIDTAALRAESRRLEDKRKRTLAMFANDDLDESDVTEILKSLKDRQAVIEAQLAASDSAPDPLAEFRGNPAQAVWDGLSVARRRVVVRLLLSARFLPTAPRTPFDPGNLEIARRH